ncbi:putative DNA binding domain-containing protein [Acidobacteria bacterium AH-259-O06]|nr:putative DNA binding domain-containing protein [Acidobacteria bacterium AH-259-O06]
MMNFKELKDIIARGEGEQVEFKRSTGQRTSAAKAVCAMLNGIGGFVVFGVTDRGKIVGQQVSAGTLEDIAAELREIEPPAFPDIETVALKQGTSAVVLTVPGGGGPFTFDGRPYLRQGPTTIMIPREEYERRLVERLHATRRWENEPVPEGVSIKDLDADEIQITLDNAIRLGRLEATDRRDTRSILRGLELIHEGNLLNAAIALYGKTDRLKTLYPQMGIRLARFRGKNRLADFSDNRQYWGHAFALLRRAESFLMDHVPIAGRVLPGKMVREDQPWYPPGATREALANAICHRDYTIPGGAVALAMYDDHLEITNPGALHFGITPEKLAKPHESKPWNPIIANVFYRAGIIERWGTGTLNIIDWCEENGNPEPTWQEQAGSVYVKFLPAVLPDTPEDTGDVGTKLGLSRDQVQIIRNLLNDKAITDLMELLGRTNRTKFRDQVLNPLIKTGFVEMTIPDKPRSSRQKYRLTDKGRESLRVILP